MAQFANIDIEGISINQFFSFSLSQSINQHHQFRLTCPAEAIDGTTGSILNTSKNLVGNKITEYLEKWYNMHKN